MSQSKFHMTGEFTKGTTVSELIQELEGYKRLYGNQKVDFMLAGDEDVRVQFDYFRNAVTINIEEEDL